jgi:hypothetical protein
VHWESGRQVSRRPSGKAVTAEIEGTEDDLPPVETSHPHNQFRFVRSGTARRLVLNLRISPVPDLDWS